MHAVAGEDGTSIAYQQNGPGLHFPLLRGVLQNRARWVSVCLHVLLSCFDELGCAYRPMVETVSVTWSGSTRAARVGNYLTDIATRGRSDLSWHSPGS